MMSDRDLFCPVCTSAYSESSPESRMCLTDCCGQRICKGCQSFLQSVGTCSFCDISPAETTPTDYKEPKRGDTSRDIIPDSSWELREILAAGLTVEELRRQSELAELQEQERKDAEMARLLAAELDSSPMIPPSTTPEKRHAEKVSVAPAPEAAPSSPLRGTAMQGSAGTYASVALLPTHDRSSTAETRRPDLPPSAKPPPPSASPPHDAFKPLIRGVALERPRIGPVKVFWDIENARLAQPDEADDMRIGFPTVSRRLHGELKRLNLCTEASRMDITAYHNPYLDNKFAIPIERVNELNRSQVKLVNIGTKAGLADHKLKADVLSCVDDITMYGLNVACIVVISSDSDFLDMHHRILQQEPMIPLVVLYSDRTYKEVKSLPDLKPSGGCYACPWKVFRDCMVVRHYSQTAGQPGGYAPQQQRYAPRYDGYDMSYRGRGRGRPAYRGGHP